MSREPVAAGKSSFNLIDPAKLFSELGLKKDMMLLDLGCGSGAYSIAASRYIGEQGIIYAVDLWKDGIDSLSREIASKHISNIHTSVADINKHIPVPERSIDLCLMATVLHDLIHDKTESGTLKEVARVLKPEGILAVIEFHKIQNTPGPPVQIRIEPGEVEKLLSFYNFRALKTINVGPFNYLSLFKMKSET